LSHFLNFKVPKTITLGESLTIEVPLPGLDSNIGSAWSIKDDTWETQVEVLNSNSCTLDTTTMSGESYIRINFTNESLSLYGSKDIQIVK